MNIYRDAEWDDYIVKAVVNGRTVGGKDGGYHTNDKEDAEGTAAAFVADLRKRPACKR